jgi:formyltetrahydrofolate synthetase
MKYAKIVGYMEEMTKDYDFRNGEASFITAEFGSDEVASDPERIVAALTDVKIRDGVLYDLTKTENIERVITHLENLTQAAYRDQLAPVATVTAIAHWYAGNMDKVDEYLETALNADCTYTLAKMIKYAVGAELTVDFWTDAVNELSREEVLTPGV